LVPWYNVEFDTLAPPYIQHNSSAKDGAGDFSWLLKYRLAAGNPENGDYSVSFSWAGTLPTGSDKNGNLAATVSPTLYAGKGFGRFDLQSTLGAVLPAGDSSKLGRPVVWNAVGAISYRQILLAGDRKQWTFYHGGPNDGRVQNFVTPGLMLSKCKLEHHPRNRLALVLGGGMQIATSQFRTYNHGLVLLREVVLGAGHRLAWADALALRPFRAGTNIYSCRLKAKLLKPPHLFALRAAIRSLAKAGSRRLPCACS
jgi:hypothetical protein